MRRWLLTNHALSGGVLRVNPLVEVKTGCTRTPPSSDRMQPCRELAQLFGVYVPNETERQAFRKAARAEAMRETMHGKRKTP